MSEEKISPSPVTELTRVMTRHGGCAQTWDATVQMGYQYFYEQPQRSARTMEMPGARIAVDLDSHGHPVGVETFGHEVGIADLLEVLRRCRWEG